MQLPQEWIPAKLKWYSIQKGYGFVTVPIDDDLEDAFLHIKLLEDKGFASLPQNQPLAVKVGFNKGKLRVTDIKVMRPR